MGSSSSTSHGGPSQASENGREPHHRLKRSESPSALKSVERLEARMGKLCISGRYHQAPHVLTDDYEVMDDVLGSGFNGVVKMAVSKEPSSRGVQQKFAVKAFKLANVAFDKRDQLMQEVEVFLCMDHPHITRLFNVYECEDFLYLVMECMEGGELFDRVIELKTFVETDAANAVWQMLLALNYIHSHGIVHRDLKLENFLYDKKGSNHLKLIDFGFSKMWDPNIKMHVSCGTLSYVAPEVLKKNYTSQCDLWSLGVICFILLAGYMPFSGPDAVQTKKITEGDFKMKPERWNKVSKQGRDFTLSLLTVSPEERLTAAQALEHGWIKNRNIELSPKAEDIDNSVIDALRQFGRASKFRRCCMEMMAWSLSNEERAQVRDYFIALDTGNHGTITLPELRKVLIDKFRIGSEEVKQIFEALDSNSDEEIHYSDFLAAMCSTRIALHDDHLRAVFKKFDVDNTGYITIDDLREVLGNEFEGENVEQLFQEADLLHDGRISYPAFVAYLRGEPLDQHVDTTVKMIDKIKGEVDPTPATPFQSLLKNVPFMRMKSQ